MRRLCTSLPVVVLIAAMLLASTRQGFAASLFRHGINITRLFDQPLSKGGVYGNPPFAPWNDEISRAELAGLRRAGYDWVRLPVDPAPFLAGSKQTREAALDELMAFLNVALKVGFSVDVDLHPNPRNPQWGPVAILDGLNGAKFVAYEAFAVSLARRLDARDPRHLTLELMNEPQAQCVRSNRPDWTLYQRQLYGRIRKQVAQLKLVVTGGCRSSIPGLADFNLAPLPDKNLYVMVHFYLPFRFTHQGASWSPTTRYLAGLRYPVKITDEPATNTATQAWIARLGLTGAAYRRAWSQAKRQLRAYFATPFDRQTINQRFDVVAHWADQMGLPRSRVLVGEFGVMSEGGGLGTSPNAEAARDAWLHDVSSAANARGFGWAIWGYHGEFGIVSDNSARVLNSGVNSALFGP